MTHKCAACNRKALPDGKYCIYHGQALQNLTEHYNTWIIAYGAISWNDFLAKLASMNETGSWVQEVIEAELNKKEMGA